MSAAPSLVLLVAVVAANLAASAFALYRMRRRELADLSRCPVPMEADTVQLLAHPAIRPSEIEDALRFGFAAAQKYLDELSAEYRVANDD